MKKKQAPGQYKKPTTKKVVPDELQVKIALLILVFVHYIYTSVLNPGLKHYNIFDRDWGFDNITYFSNWLKYVIYLIIILHIIFYQHIGELIAKYVKYGFFLLLSIISVFIFRGLTIKYDLLGDMRIRMVQTFNQEYLRNSYLTMYLLYHLYQLLSKLINISHELYFTWISYVCGAVYVFFALLIADLLGNTGRKKVVLFLSQVFLGSMLYFTGYKEIYALPYLAVIIAIYLNLLYANGKIRIVLPLIATFMLPAFHILLAGFIPALAVIFIRRNLKIMPAWIKKIKTPYFLILMLIGLIVLYKMAKSFGISFELLPAKNTDGVKNYMTLFDYRHIWQYFNGLILGAGLSFLVYIFMIKEVISKKLKFDNTIWYLGSASIFLLTIIFIVNPIRGSGDWDIFALPSVLLSLSGFYAVMYYYGKINWVNQVLWVLILINMVSSGTWLFVNHTDKSVDKIADMLLKDPGYYYARSQPATQLLAISFTENGLTDLGMKYYYKNYRENYTDPRAHYNYAMRLIENKREKEGMDILENLVNISPEYPLSYDKLIWYFNKNKMYNELYSTIDKMYKAFVKNPNAFGRIPKKQLISYFTYLKQVKLNLKDQKSAAEIDRVLAALQ